jgi:hypothetical protein
VGSGILLKFRFEIPGDRASGQVVKNTVRHISSL